MGAALMLPLAACVSVTTPRRGAFALEPSSHQVARSGQEWSDISQIMLARPKNGLSLTPRNRFH
jgi:hypothetical protein